MNTGPFLSCGEKVSIEGHIAVGHARRVEGKPGIAMAVEKNQAAGAMRSFGKQMNRFSRGEFCR